MMRIRKTVETDLAQIGEIYANAKRFMAATGNPHQWNDERPNIATAREDMEKGIGYVVEEEGKILAVFMFSQALDPTYATIYGGKWLSDAPYGVIHRIAVAKQGQGIIGYCINECFAHCGNLRIDTHRDNVIMHHILRKYGFIYCGVIYLANGEARDAYQLTIKSKNNRKNI